MDHQKKIGVFIRQARERQNITKETLARSLQISEAELSAWEEGVSYPALTQAPALARELAVSLDELFNARYHTVAQDYQASEACFLHEQPQPADAPDQDETKETPALQVPVESQVQSRPRLPAWTRLLLAGCLIVEAKASHTTRSGTLIAAARGDSDAACDGSLSPGLKRQGLFSNDFDFFKSGK